MSCHAHGPLAATTATATATATGRHASRTPKARKSRLSERPRTASGQGSGREGTTTVTNANCTEAVHQRGHSASRLRVPPPPSPAHTSLLIVHPLLPGLSIDRLKSGAFQIQLHNHLAKMHTMAALVCCCIFAAAQANTRARLRQYQTPGPKEGKEKKKASSTQCPRSAVMNRRHDMDRALADVALAWLLAPAAAATY